MTDRLALPIEGIPVPEQPWLYSERLVIALQAAAVMHASQTRKGTRVAYLTHLLGTCAIALDHGAGETEAIAALLHDAIEDVRPTKRARQTVAWFGPDVLHIVEACTDGVPGPAGEKGDWLDRKRAYVDHIAGACAPVLLVSASDKLHNARSILADQRAVGDEVFTRFSKGKDGTLWYYRALVDAYRANPDHVPELIDELDRTVEEIERLAG